MPMHGQHHRRGNVYTYFFHDAGIPSGGIEVMRKGSRVVRVGSTSTTSSSFFSWSTPWLLSSSLVPISQTSLQGSISTKRKPPSSTWISTPINASSNSPRTPNTNVTPRCWSTGSISLAWRKCARLPSGRRGGMRSLPIVRNRDSVGRRILCSRRGWIWVHAGCWMSIGWTMRIIWGIWPIWDDRHCIIVTNASYYPMTYLRMGSFLPPSLDYSVISCCIFGVGVIVGIEYEHHAVSTNHLSLIQEIVLLHRPLQLCAFPREDSISQMWALLL